MDVHVATGEEKGVRHTQMYVKSIMVKVRSINIKGIVQVHKEITYMS